MYWVTGILGLILAMAPFIFGYNTNSVALWTSLIIGIGTLIVSWVEGAHSDHERWEYWTAVVLGIVAILSPFVLGFIAFTSATWSSVVIGVLIALFAGSRLLTTGRR